MPGDFNFPLNHALAHEHAVIAEFLGEIQPPSSEESEIAARIKKHETQIVPLDPHGQLRMVAAIIPRLVALRIEVQGLCEKHSADYFLSTEWRPILETNQKLLAALSAILKKEPPLSDKLINELLNWASKDSESELFSGFLAEVAAAAASYAKRSPLSEATVIALTRFLETLEEFAFSLKTLRDSADQIASILGYPPDVPLEPGDEWAEAVYSYIDELAIGKQTAWVEVLRHCEKATSASPSKKWLTTATDLLQGIGWHEFRLRLLAWLPLVERLRPAESRFSYLEASSMAVSDDQMNILRGLVWMCGISKDRDLARALTVLALSAYRNVPGIGPRAVRVGNACITALAMIGGPDAVGQLAVLKVKVKFGTAQAQIEKALAACAKKSGIPRDE